MQKLKRTLLETIFSACPSHSGEGLGWGVFRQFTFYMLLLLRPAQDEFEILLNEQ